MGDVGGEAGQASEKLFQSFKHGVKSLCQNAYLHRITLGTNALVESTRPNVPGSFGNLSQGPRASLGDCKPDTRTHYQRRGQ